MKLGFRYPRRWYPYRHRPGQKMPTAIMRDIFAWARAVGFDGCELSTAHQDFPAFSATELDEVARELADAGLEAASYNPGGFSLGANDPVQIRRLLGSVAIANRLGAKVINLTLPGPAAAAAIPGLPSEYLVGAKRPLGSGSGRSADEKLQVAATLAQLCDRAQDHGLVVSLEIHQNSYIDDSDLAIALLNQIDRPNAGLNPDLGNILWAHAIPIESSEDAMAKLARHAAYVHLKNLRRLFVPGLDRAAFVRTSLLERGDIDWRWAISELAAAGYQGYLTFEGDYSEGWDFRRAMEQNAAYVRGLIAPR